MGKIYWKIYGENLRGKFAGKICGENLWESQQFEILTTNDPPAPSAQSPPEGAGGLLVTTLVCKIVNTLIRISFLDQSLLERLARDLGGITI